MADFTFRGGILRWLKGRLAEVSRARSGCFLFRGFFRLSFKELGGSILVGVLIHTVAFVVVARTVSLWVSPVDNIAVLVLQELGVGVPGSL